MRQETKEKLLNILFFTSLFPISAILIYFLNKSLIDAYWFNEFVGGWDGSGHYAIAKVYAETIFPSFWGWVPNWYNGMPFPQFYPPLFYYIYALLYHTLNIDSAILFKSIVLILAFLIPFFLSLIYFLHVKKSKLQSFFVFVLSVLFISAKTEFGFIGVSLSSILNNGLVTQPLSFIFLLLWLIFFLNIEKKYFNFFWSIIFLALIFLSNAHVTIVSFLIFSSIFFISIINKKNIDFNLCFRYFLSGFIALIITFFWYLPMINFYDFFTGKSLGSGVFSDLGNLYKDHYYFLIFILIGGIFGFFKKNTFISSISLSVMFISIIYFIRIYDFYPKLPFHIDRWIGTLYFLTSIFIVYTLTEVKKIFKKSNSIVLFHVFLILSFIHISYLTVSTGIMTDDTRGIYINKVTEDIIPILQKMKSRDGLILVEWYTPYHKPSTVVLNSYLGLQGNKTNFSIIRESSASSIFWVPIRNSLSIWPECYGIKCNLAFDTEYLDNDFENQVMVAKEYGVKYLIIRSFESKIKLEKSGLVKKIFEQKSGWSIYEIKDIKAPIPDREAILVFSDFNTKSMPERRFDFISLVEEINLKRARTDYTFVYSNEQKIDINKDIDADKFKYILLEDYKYNDIDYATKKIRNFIEGGGKIIFLPSQNEPLLSVSQLFKRKDSFLIQEDLPSENFENEYDGFVNKLDNFVSYKDQSSRLYKKFNITYFPSWKSTRNENVYIYGPNQILVFDSGNPTFLYFETPKVVIWAHLVSLFGLIFLLIYSIVKFSAKSI